MSRIISIALAFFLCIATPSVMAQGGTCTGSSNIAFIDSPVIVNGGVLPTSGGAFASMTFSNLPVGSVNAANLAAYDTVVLNVASPGMGCTTATLSAGQKADLNAFVAGGGKLIIYDSECTFGGAVDYTWLPHPFTTVNPGAQGFFGGTLTIAEDNDLSSAMPASPLYIDTNLIATTTDAVGDMNVVDLTTVDPAWCLDMTGTNVLNFSGAVHMYVRSGNGLYIYNGLDVDFIGPVVDSSASGQLAKIWLQELQVGCSFAGLPCGVPVVGISLSPATASGNVGDDHMVTALVTDLFGVPQPGLLVTFDVLSGPNMGAVGDCIPVNCMTDANGEVSFTYAGLGGIGIDMIQACFTSQLGDLICSTEASMDWLNSPPVCFNAFASSTLLWPPNHKFVPIEILGVTDPEGDPFTITIDSIFQDETVTGGGVGAGTTSPDCTGIGNAICGVRAERNGSPLSPGNGRFYHVSFTATDVWGASCSGTVKVCVPHSKSPRDVPVDDGPLFDSSQN